MRNLMHAAVALAAGGLTITMIELLLPRSEIRRTARAAIGLVFLELLASAIADIFR